MTPYHGHSTGSAEQQAFLVFEEEDQTYVPESMPTPEPYQDFATGPAQSSREHGRSPRSTTQQHHSRSHLGYEQRSGYVPVGSWQSDQAQYMNIRCAQGYHESRRKFGLCGICSAVLLFPLGIIFLFLDSEKRCKECGVILDTGHSTRPYH